MANRIDKETGMKLPKGDSKREWRRWKNAGSSRERNNERYLQRVKIFAKKFGLSTEEADEFSFTG